MDKNPVRITDIITSEYSDFLDFCVSSGKNYVEELTNVDFVAFRSVYGKSREYVSIIKNVIENPEKINKSIAIEDDKIKNDVVDEDVLFDEQIKSNDLIVGSESLKFNNDQEVSVNISEFTDIAINDLLSKEYNYRYKIEEILNVQSEDFKEIKIDVLQLSTRSYHCLVRTNCLNLADVLSKTVEELLAIHNMGLKSFNEILLKLKDYVEVDDSQYHLDNNVDNTGLASNELNSVIEAMLTNNNYSTDVLTEKQLKFLDKLCEAADIVGKDMCLLAYRNPKYCVGLVQAFQIFCLPYARNKNIFDKVTEYVEKLPINIKSKKVNPFIKAYNVSTNVNVKLLLSLCDEDTTINKLPSFFESSEQRDDIQKLTSLIYKFLEWLNFDIYELADSISANINRFIATKNAKAVKIFNMRLAGKTLDEIGDAFHVTKQRIRQIEDKFYRLFWFAYRNQNYDIIMLIYALRNGASFLYYNEIEEFVGDFTQTLWICLKNSSEHEYYYYSKNLDALAIQADDKQNISEAELLQKINDAMNQLPDILISEKVLDILTKLSEENAVPVEVLKTSFDNTYSLSGLCYYRRNALTVVFMCQYVLKNRFQAGFKINDKYECDRFHQYMIELFGDKACATTNRAIDAKICEVGCLCDRGKYIHPDFLHIDSNVINQINDYISSSPRSVISYGDIYEALKDVFEGTQITNRYLLQGALKKYKCDFKMNRDYIKKDISISFDDEFEAFVEERGIVHKSEIFAEFISITESRLAQIASRSANVFNIDNGYYIHSSMFDIQPEDYVYLKQYLAEACKDIPVHIYTVYEYIETHFYNFMYRNDFENKNKLYAALNYMFKEEFSFSRPYIAQLGIEEISNKSVIIKHIQEYDIIDIEELIDICYENNINYISTSYLVKMLMPEYVRINATNLMKYECTDLNDDIIIKAGSLVEEMLESNDYVVNSKINDFIWFPEIGLEWNEFLLENIITRYKKINIISLIKNPLKYSNSVYVTEKYKNDTFDSLLIKILSDKVKKGMFTSKFEIREWLREEGFILGRLPDFLENTKYFYVDETGVHCREEE